MHEAKKKVEKICEMRAALEKATYAKLMSDVCEISTAEGGMFVDMIKDLAEAEKNIWKACYYKKMVEGMEPMNPEEIEEFSRRMGYDNWRYMSSERFAPKGHGTYSPGYTPMPNGISDISYIPEPMNRNMRRDDAPYGYRNGDDPLRGNMRRDAGGTNQDGKYGKAYNQWSESRRNYTMTNSQSDKYEMDHHAKEHLKDSMESIREVWKNADPDLRKSIKSNLTSLINEMPA